MVRFPFAKFIIRRRSVEIEPEEIFMDAVNRPGFSQEMHEGRLERPIKPSAFAVFGAILGLIFLLVFSRLGELQIYRGGAFLERAEANKTYSILIRAPRGTFFDRAFNRLVENIPNFTMSLAADRFADDAEFATSLERSASLVGKTVSEIADANELADGRRDPAHLATRASWPAEIFFASGDLREASLEAQAHLEEYPGLVIAESGRRYYPFGAGAGHLVGYVGRPSKSDLTLRPAVRPSDLVGKTGLERVYEDRIRGTDGEKLVEVDATGAPLRERFTVKPVAGHDLLLEVDADLQEFAAKTLARHLVSLGKRAGAVVLLDPRDGAVRALTSYPSFDPNAFGEGSGKEVMRLLNDPAEPFFNRAITGGYPAGSTIKPLLATAALEERVITPEREILSTGALTVPNPYDPAKPSIFKDWRALGWVDMRRALAMSSNVYFYTVGGGFGDIKGLGITRIKQYLERFGWGSGLGIDLPGEYAGLIPDPEKKKVIRPQDPTWRIGDTYITSIGQGDLQVTPLQLASAIAAIANDGTLWQPRIARAVLDSERNVIEEFKPRAIRRDLAKHESLQVVREGMREAVISGSAVALSNLFFPVAGKTGTAQTGVYGKNHGWFVGFAPYDAPELVVAVLVEEGTGGSTDAVPIAKEILYHYFANDR